MGWLKRFIPADDYHQQAVAIHRQIGNEDALRHDASALATFDTKLATVASARRIDVLGGSAGLARQ